MSIDVDKLESLYRQATTGPWSWEAVGEKDNSWCLGVEYEGEVVDFVAQSGGTENLADPALIVAMHEALPALIADVRRLRALESTLGGTLLVRRDMKPDNEGDEFLLARQKGRRIE